MKKQLLRTMLLLCALVAGSGSVWADEVTLTKGTNGSACTVNNQDGIKVGTSSKGGDMTITVPANTTKLTLHAAAWKGVTGLSLNISGATASPASISLTADDGISNNSPFTLSGNESDFVFEITLSDIKKETEIKFTSSIAKRFVVWGASATTSGGGSSEPVAVTGVSVDPTSWTMVAGENKTLTASVMPADATNKAVTWSSNDESVATVSNSGVVSAVAAGTATITATTVDGGFTATCDLTVTAAPEAALTFDFTDTGWGFPADYTLTEETYTNGGFTFTLGAVTTGGHKALTSGSGENKIQTALIFGKEEGASITFPAFAFNVNKIKVYGASGASGSVSFNIFVGENEVSTEVTSSKVTQAFDIAVDKQTAGTIYTLKLTNANNCQISKIEIFGYVPVTISDAEYATLVAPAALDFSESGIKAYTVKANTTSVTLNEVANGQVPAGAAVVLYKAGGATVNVPVIAEAAALADNDLVAGPVAAGDNAEGTAYYVLGKEGDKVGFGLLKSGVGLSANKAYIPAAKFGAAAPSFIPFSVGETTAIRGIESGELRMENFFDLQGRRVAQPTKGLYIVNGRKVAIK